MGKLRRFQVSPRAVLALGGLSALALFSASLMDFGDPRIEARANAAEGAEVRRGELRLGWEAIRQSSAPPPGTVASFAAEADASPLFALPEDPTPGAAVEPIFDVLVASAQAQLAAGEAEEALGSLRDALVREAVGAVPRSVALFEAAKAAGALGMTEASEAYRNELLAGAADGVVEGTSVRLLACLLAPPRPAKAWELLASGELHLPAPADVAKVEDGALKVRLDVWWTALENALKNAAAATQPGRSWRSAFRVPEREGRAVAALFRSLEGPPPEASSDWRFVEAGGVVLAAAERSGQQHVHVIDPDALARGWNAKGNSRYTVHFATDLAPELEPEPLSMGPFQFAVEPPSASVLASSAILRIQILRAGLVGLGLLTFIASLLSARAIRRSRRLSELRSTFVASVSHDLRTPTQAILLLAETLEQGEVSSDEARGRYHVQIRREAQRLRRMVEDLLDGARVDRGAGARIARRRVEPKVFFDELAGAMKESGGPRGADVHFDARELPETVEVDPDGVHRALWNLFENAIKHGRGSDGGRVQITITAELNGDLLCCSVADDGPGIPAQHLDTVFQAFERLGDRGPKGSIHLDTGTGLGLAIVRSLAEAHGGTAEALPTQRGAKIVATFRIHEQEEVA